ncbi:cytochrome c3 family protein [Oceanipulchritudo coccoides]|nr:cytochrome c3 family protein [Oceanipulchritudo coccoides]
MKSRQLLANIPSTARLWITLSAILVGFLACQSINRTVLTVPQTAGAEFVGSEDCLLCHEDVGHNFSTTAHARLMVDEDTGLELGCESCHGPGSLHSMEGEGRHLIHNPRRNAETCLQCHMDVQGQLALPHSHPVAGGQVTCVDCHDPHGDSDAELMADGILMPEMASCTECHPAQSGPFVFEHEAGRDGCTVCHDPHGSVNAKMLKVGNANLCLQCHFTEQRSNALMIGGVDHTGFGFIQQGTCWTAGCHEAVHGSHVNGSLRF